MNKKSLKSKLSFNKEVLRTLSSEHMAKVQGGGLYDMLPASCENACTQSSDPGGICGSQCGPCSKCG